jgi:hypothetical protein
VIAQSQPTPSSDHPRAQTTAQTDADQDAFVHEPDIEPPASVTSSHGSVDAARPAPRSMLSSVTLRMVAGGAAAALGGGIIGFWLGRRSAARHHKPVLSTSSSVGAAAALVPVVGQLLANPIVRGLVLRMLVRKMTPRALS